MKFSSTKLRALVESDQRTSKQIAELGRFSAPALSMWACGNRVPGADELASLAQVFNVDIHDLYEAEHPDDAFKCSSENRVQKGDADIWRDRALSAEKKLGKLIGDINTAMAGITSVYTLERNPRNNFAGAEKRLTRKLFESPIKK